jgi:hypothetical protein
MKYGRKKGRTIFDPAFPLLSFTIDLFFNLRKCCRMPCPVGGELHFCFMKDGVNRKTFQI